MSALPLLLLFAAPADPLAAGFGVADVTPPPTYRLGGDYREMFAAGVRDPLVAKALYLKQGDRTAALVVIDICGLNPELSADIRSRIEKATGVPAGNVSLTATHTHTGPQFYDSILTPLHVEQTVAAHGKDIHCDGSYPKKFAAGCVAAVVAAKAAAKPVTVSVGIGSAPNIAFHRRFKMKDGSVRTNPGRKNPNTVGPAGPTDDALPVIQFASDKTPTGLLTAFAMHATTERRNDRYSADYPGHLAAAVAKERGPAFVTITGQGCAGNTNQINVNADRDPTSPEIGATLAAAVLKAPLADTPASLGVATGIVKLPLRADRPADVPACRERLKAAKGEFLDLVEAYRVLMVNRLRKQHGDANPVRVFAVRVGADAAFVTLPHEVFVEIGLDIKRRSPFRTTVVLTIADEIDDYLPTKSAYPDGAYEVTNTPYQPGSAEMIADEAVRLLDTLKPR